MTRLYIYILSTVTVLAGVAAVLTGRLTLAFCLLLGGYLCLAWLWSRDGLHEALKEAAEAVEAENASREKEAPAVREPERKPAGKPTRARGGRPGCAGTAAWGLVALSTAASAFMADVNALSRLLMAAVAFVSILIAYNFYKREDRS